jgi:hypothetical protein
MVWFLIALFLDRVMLKIAMTHYRNEYSAGYAAINPVLSGRSLAPIAYRVLTPWIIGSIEHLVPKLKKHRLVALYEPLRILSISAALYASNYSLGTIPTLIVAAALPATFLFDFSDWPFELLSFALALSNNMPLAILAAGLHGLARPETAPLAGITFGLHNSDPLGGALVLLSALIAVGVVRLVVGRKKLVMPMGTAWRLNRQDLRDFFKNRPFYLSEVGISLVVIALTFVMIMTGQAGNAWPVPLALCVAQITFQARLSETRSLTPCLLWIGMGASSWL